MPALPDLPQTEAAIVELTNAFRQEQRLGTVAPNKELAAAARWFADYLARTGKFGHQADGREPQERAAAHGYRFCMVGENLAMNLDSRGFTSQGLAIQTVEGWKASPPHRRTLLEPAVTEIGIAVARVPDKHPRFVSVQLLGRPESLKVELKIQNMSTQTVSYTLAGESHSIDPRTAVTHTSCEPGEVMFQRAGAASPIARFPMRDGAAFTIRPGEGASVSVHQDDGAARK